MGGYKNIKPEDNPKPFKKGQSGNPKGGSKNRRALKDIKEILIDKLGAEEGQRGDIEVVFEALIKNAKSGDLGSIRELLERIYGKVKQDVEVKGNIVLVFDHDDKDA